MAPGSTRGLPSAPAPADLGFPRRREMVRPPAPARDSPPCLQEVVSGLRHDLAGGGSRDGPVQPPVQPIEILTAQDLLPLCLAYGDAARFQDLDDRRSNSFGPTFSPALSPSFSPALGLHRGIPIRER